MCGSSLGELPALTAVGSATLECSSGLHVWNDVNLETPESYFSYLVANPVFLFQNRMDFRCHNGQVHPVTGWPAGERSELAQSQPLAAGPEGPDSLGKGYTRNCPCWSRWGRHSVLSRSSSCFARRQPQQLLTACANPQIPLFNAVKHNKLSSSTESRFSFAVGLGVFGGFFQ